MNELQLEKDPHWTSAAMEILSLSDKVYSIYKNNLQEIMQSKSTASASADGDPLEYEFGDKTVKNQTDDTVYAERINSLLVHAPKTDDEHVWSLSSVFKCVYCKKLIQADISHRIECISNRFTVTPTGCVANSHKKATDWNLTQHINEMKTVYRYDWKLIYWRLWSECHYLFCSVCKSFYPVIDSEGCRWHCKKAVFRFVDEKGVSTRTHPVGRFLCCQANAYNFESILRSKNTSGCKTTFHTPLLLNTEEGNRPKNDNRVDPVKIDDACNVIKDTEDMRLGLIERGLCVLKNGYKESGIEEGSDAVEDWHHLRPTGWKPINIANRRDVNALNVFFNACSDMCEVGTCRQVSKECLYSDGCCLPMQDVNCEEKYFNRPIRYMKRTNRHKKTKCGLQGDEWVNRFSTRYNQDKQREYENRFFDLLNAVLTERAEEFKTSVNNKTSVTDQQADQRYSGESETESSRSSYCSTLSGSVRVRHSRTTSVWNSYVPLAGSFVRINAELRESCCNWQLEDGRGDRCLMDKDTDALLMQMKGPLNPRARKPPTFTVQQYSYCNRKLCSRWSVRSDIHTLSVVPKTKVLQVPLLKEKCSDELHLEIWRFDTKSQELDYLSAAYMPLPIIVNSKRCKYLKTIKNELSNDWNDMVDLEKSWNAFLRMFFENELLPSEDDVSPRFCYG